MIIEKKKIIIFLTFLLLVISNNNFMIKFKINTYMEIISYLLLSGEIVYSLLSNKKEKKWKELLFFFLVLFLLSIGIVVQANMSIIIKIRLLFTSFIISIITTCSKNYVNDMRLFKSISFGIITGIFISILLALISNIPLKDIVHEGINTFGFNGGLQYKNFFASTVLAAFMALYVHNRLIQFKKSNVLILILLFFLLLMSSSRGTYLLLIIFILLFNHKKIINYYLKIYNKYKVLTVLLSVSFIMIVAFASVLYVRNSSTYMYRVRGVYNYIKFYKKDIFHLFFGDAKSAFSNPNINYVWNIRNHIKGYDGSYEMGLINVLIKNGIVGIIGYILLLGNMVRNFKQTNKNYKIINISVFIVLIISSFVESYICNIHALFGVFCYLIISGKINKEAVK